MFRKIWWIISLILYLFFFLFISYFIFSLINLIFDLISCRFPPWFPKGRELSLDYVFFRDLYYFVGFLDYAAISLPEIITVDLKTSDPLMYQTISYVAWIYSGIVNNFYEFLYTVIYGNTECFDINFVLSDLGLDSDYELNSLCANNMQIILMDPENGLDKYLFNIDINVGAYQDTWEMKGVQVEYIKHLARNSYVFSEYLYTKNSDELWNYKDIAVSFEEETLLKSIYANFDALYGKVLDSPTAARKFYIDLLHLKNPIDKERDFTWRESWEYLNSSWRESWEYFNSSLYEYWEYFSQEQNEDFYNIIEDEYYINIDLYNLLQENNRIPFINYLKNNFKNLDLSNLNSKADFSLDCFIDKEFLKFLHKSSFVRHNDSFSCFYKIVMHTNRFFFDNFYVYFYIEKYNILIRINRFVLSDIFHKNIVWGLTDLYRYPYSILWNYNYYDLFNDLYGTPYIDGLISNKSLNSRIMDSTHPFDYIYPEENDFFLNRDFWKVLLKKDSIKVDLESANVENLTNVTEVANEAKTLEDEAKAAVSEFKKANTSITEYLKAASSQHLNNRDIWKVYSKTDSKESVIDFVNAMNIQSKNFEWFFNLTEFRDETFQIDSKFYDTVFGVSCTPELTSDMLSYDETLIERDFKLKKLTQRDWLAEAKQHSKAKPVKPSFLFKLGKAFFLYGEEEPEYSKEAIEGSEVVYTIKELNDIWETINAPKEK